MDIFTFKKRMEELEFGIKELRFDYDLDAHSGFKLEELRNELYSIEKEEKFFLKMKITAIGEREKLHTAELKLLDEGKVQLLDNYELKEHPEYCKVINDLDKCEEKYDIGVKYFRLLQKEKKIITEKIHEIELRQTSFE